MRGAYNQPCRNDSSKHNISEVQVEESMETNFSRLKGYVYLDYAGAGLYSDRQMDAVHKDLVGNLYGNPHTRNHVSVTTTDLIDQARIRIAEHFHTTLDDYDVVFTSGTTGSLKLVADAFNFAPVIDGVDGTGMLAMLEDNHTSVVGMREVVATRDVNVRSVKPSAVRKLAQQSTTNNNNRPSCLDGDNLFIYPAMSNFSGDIYPLEWIEAVQNGALRSLTSNRGRWLCLLDAASYVTCHDLDLSKYKADLVTLSFYKMFGYPTGLGALLVRRDTAAHTLNKCYYGGGTVSVTITPYRYRVLKESLHDRFEDGTLPFLSIVSLKHGFEALQAAGGMCEISRRTLDVVKYTYEELSSYRYENEAPVAQIYAQSDFKQPGLQGPIITFNLLRPDGEYIPFTEVEEMCNISNIMVRTGCFCNTGACQHYLKLTSEDVMSHFKAGHVCGDKMSIIEGRPTGAVRVSYGYPSTRQDADAFLRIVHDCFLIYKMSIPKELSTNNFMEQAVRISHIFIYPIKSCASQQVTSWMIGKDGLRYDRRWMIVTDTGLVLNMKRETRLCNVQPTLDLITHRLHISYPGRGSVSVPIELHDQTKSLPASNMCNSKVCGSRVEGYDCGPEVNQWLDQCLDRTGCRLICYKPPATASKYKKSPNSTENKNFANESKYTLISEISLEWLSANLLQNDDFLSGEELQEGAWTKEELMSRFRSNFVVDGSLQQLQEETWRRFSVNNVDFNRVKPCSRCQVIGIKDEQKCTEPLRTLSILRGQLMYFGINFSSDHLGDDVTISVGDQVEVHEQQRTEQAKL